MGAMYFEWDQSSFFPKRPVSVLILVTLRYWKYGLVRYMHVRACNKTHDGQHCQYCLFLQYDAGRQVRV